MEAIMSFGPWVAVAACVGWMLVQAGERSEDRRRRVGVLATSMTEKKFPAPLVDIFSEYAIGDRSGAMKAFVDFVKLMKDPKQREQMHTQFLQDSLDAGLANPDTLAKIKTAVDVKTAELARAEEAVYQKVAAEKVVGTAKVPLTKTGRAKRPLTTGEKSC